MSDRGDPAVNDAARAMDALRRIVHALHSANARTESSLRVSAAQLFVLRQIDAEPGISMSGLAERTRSAQSSVSEVVARLVAEDLVERSRSLQDGRRAELRVTKKGKKVAGSSRETVQEQLVAAFERLPAADRATLASLMDLWLAEAELDTAPARFFFSPGS